MENRHVHTTCMYIYFMSPKISTFATLLKMLVAWFRCCSTRHSCLYRVPLSAVLLRLQPAVAFGSVLPSGIALLLNTELTEPDMDVYACVHIHVHICIYPYRREREREKERERERETCMYVYIYIHGFSILHSILFYTIKVY